MPVEISFLTLPQVNWIEMVEALTWPVAILLSALVLGFILEKWVYRQIQRFTINLQLPFIPVALAAFKGMPFLWTTLIGVDLALLSLNLSDALSNQLQKGLTIVFLFTGVVIFARVFTKFVEYSISRFAHNLPSTSIFTIITRIVIYSIGFMVILQTMGISITPLITALGIGGLAISLAFQDTFANLFAGVHILVSRQIAPGHFIELDSGEKGYVRDINWRNTTIEHLYNYLYIIPNSKVANAVITNYHYPKRRVIVAFEMGVSYDSDLRQVEAITNEVMEETMHQLGFSTENYKPRIRYNRFNDFSIDFKMLFEVPEYTEFYKIRHEFIKNLHDRYKQEGIVIPFPIRTLDMPKALIDDLQEVQNHAIANN